MRYWRFILCFYFMLLSIMPCNDVEECHTAVQTTIASIEDHGDHSHETEMCSPFCACLCCGQFISFSSDVIELRHFSSYTNPTTTIHKSGYPLDVHLAIWQPPKIS